MDATVALHSAPLFSVLLFCIYRAAQPQAVYAVPGAGAVSGEGDAQAVLDKDLMAMKVTELKEELAARGEALSGNKAWLHRGAGGQARQSSRQQEVRAVK